MRKKIVFLDIDDTLADTSHYVIQKFKTKFFTLNDKKMFLKNIFSILGLWIKIKNNHTFWEELPLKKDALLTYQKAKQISSEIHILTALPVFIFPKNKKAFELAAQAKKNWVKNHFPDIPEENIHVCYAKEKHLKISNPHHDFILVDDSQTNISRWIKSGGIGILVERNSCSHLFKLNALISCKHDNETTKINLK